MPDPIHIDATVPDTGGAPLIQPAGLNFGGNEIQIALDVDPEQFPNGLEFLVMAPGQLQPLGKMLVATGCMVAVVPPEMSHHLRNQVKQAKHLQAGHVDAPGVRRR